HAAATPLVEFVGREAHTSDLCGEKLHEGWVREVLERAFREAGVTPRFAMLVPEWEPPHRYTLVLEAEDGAEPAWLAARVDELLRDGHHYDYCRRLGQLEAVTVLRVRAGWSAYLERCAALGQRRGGVKPAALRREPGWGEWFRQSAEPGVPAAEREK